MAVALRDLERGQQRRPTLRVVHGRPSPPAPPQWIFWARRLVVALVLTAAVAGAVATLRASSADAAATGRVEVSVVLPAGETLWDLAGRYAPAGADRSSWVVDVAARNDLDPGAIPAGTPVLVPLGGDGVTAMPRQVTAP